MEIAEVEQTAEEMALEVRRLSRQLLAAGRKDLLLRAIGAPLLEELRIEAARAKLSRLLITKDYRFVLVDYEKEVELQPVHKAVYLLFLAHPEGIEFKRLGDYRDELTRYYMATAKLLDKEKIVEGVDHLVNPLDAGQRHQREMFAHQEGVLRHDGPLRGELLHHQRPHAETLCGFCENMVRAAEDYQITTGTGNQGGQTIVYLAEERRSRIWRTLTSMGWRASIQ